MTRSRSVLAVGLALVVAWAWSLTQVMESGRADLWSALVIGPMLVLVSVPMVGRAARADGWPAVLPLLWLVLLLKFAASYVRYVVAFDVYGGSSDSLGYHKAGRQIAEGLWRGDLRIPLPPVGTEAMEVATGVVYAVIGPTLLGGFLVFGWLALWGQWCCYRAFRIALPNGSCRAYAVGVLFLPSLLYWPSSVGKESVMLLAIGLVSLGVARVTTGTTGGAAPLVVGLALAGFIRPHVAVLLTAGLFVALLVRRPTRRTITSPIAHVGGLLVGAGLVGGLALAAARFLGVDEVTVTSVQDTLESTAERTTTGGSQFTAHPVTSVADFPSAAVSVLFRPWPWEAHNALALLAGAESLLLLVLVAFAWRRVLGVPRLVLQEPYVAYTVVYLVLFVIAFSTFGNFGLLVRERTQVLPFLLAVAFMPRRRTRPPVAPLRPPPLQLAEVSR
jgi:hypothetical protein